MKPKASDVYLRFLKSRQNLRDAGGLALDANQRVLLEEVVLAWDLGRPMTVGQAIALVELGSPATLHKRLMVLREQGLLTEMAVEGDRRTKFLVATPKALEYFNGLGGAMRASVGK